MTQQQQHKQGQGRRRRRPNNRKQRSTQNSKFLQFQFAPGSEGGLAAYYNKPSVKFNHNESCQTCIETNATYCSKAHFRSVLVRADGSKVQDYKSLDKLLQLRPNPTMPAAVFWERVAYYYYAYNNSFIYSEKDSKGDIVALWSIDPTSVRYTDLETGEILLKFMVDGREKEVLHNEIIHISRNVVDNLLFGQQPSPAIQRVLDLINLNYKGIEKAIIYSQVVRFIAESTTKLADDVIEQKARKLAKLLDVGEKATPVAVVDNSLKLTPVEPNKQDRANYAEVKQWNEAVYKFYGISEAVLNGTADENGMVAYYERTIEPFFIRVAQELTYKLFTPREYDCGNRIEFDDQKLTYRSMATKLAIFTAARELGAFTLGTLGDLLGLPVPAEKRNETVVSQNYFDSQQANETAEEATEDDNNTDDSTSD